MSQIVQGIVRGGRIELVDGPELTDGQRVQVVIELSRPADQASSEEGTVWMPLDDPVLIEVLARIRRERRPLLPSPTGPGRKSATGMLAEDSEFDTLMAEVERARIMDYG
jgi:hypothetical protein